MKNKKYIIIFTIFGILLILLLGLYELCQYETHTGIISSINNTVNGTNFYVVSPNGHGNYTFTIGNAIIKDSEGKKIDVQSLKVGDYIFLVNRKGAIPSDLPVRIPNVKSIKLLGNNLQVFNEYLSFISLDNSNEYLLSDLDWINLLTILDSYSVNSSTTVNYLPKSENFSYIPRGISNYQYTNKTGDICDTIIEIHENELHIVKNFWDYTQTETIISDERFHQLKKLLNKYEI